MNEYILLLEELEPLGLKSRYNVSPFIVKYFDPPLYDVKTNHWSDGLRVANDFLKEMLKSGHIHFNLRELNVLTKPNYAGIPFWYDKSPFLIRLGIKGVEYLNQQRLIKSALDLNSASKQGMIRSIIIAGVTAFVAFCSVIISYLNYKHTLNDERILDKSTTTTNKLFPSQLSKELPLQNAKTSPKDSSRKAQPSSSNSGQKTSVGKVK